MTQLEQIFKAIKEVAIRISEEIKYADLGYTAHENATGDTQLKLDVLSDEIITAKFKELECVKALVSEEKDDALNLNENSKYIIAYDPLDGSSLVDVNFAVGSIFGIYENELNSQNLVAAVYSIYGPRLELVINDKKGSLPSLYRLAKDGEFKFVKELKLNEKGKLNATGATQKGWSEKHIKFIRELFLQGHRLRYSGAMVSDLHQILLKGGGLFSYPATSDAPNGKLRVLFEVLPFAFIYENAGGATSSGVNDSLFDITISKTHQTTPCFFGSKFEINLMHKFYE
ncbi:class 1 fructose-bisphosphatase [Campylobacter sp. RM12920]|uniref:Fructose-1,6-bisphosphatase class 1 n=1 Tax=Campylobacter californiensis TaxID=1032243 RepID=A0ABD4JJK4_9BACT|nr:class 1 fructose-bisphosphatase [Campylobacter sp. RM12919]MBE2987804.1 class 1 fructose-bisphosphatase [Campylobacter sp. RM12920]